MIDKIINIDLRKDFVGIHRAKFVEVNGEYLRMGDSVDITSYTNSPKSRQNLEDNEPQEVVSSVFAYWGDEPTEKDPEPPQRKQKTEVDTESLSEKQNLTF